MNDIHIDDLRPRLTPEEMYTAFTPNQAGLANALEAGVFAATDHQALDHFHDAGRRYANNTRSRTYVEAEDQTPVIEYVADKIDASYNAAIEHSADSPTAMLNLYRRVFDQYWRLARYPGHDLPSDELVRTYFPMRELYRRAATTAHQLGDEAEVKRWQQDWLQYSNGPEAAMRPYDPEYQERADLYDRFLLDKEDGDIWHEVAHRAEHEDERGEIPRYELQTISTQELSELASLLRSQTKDEQYATLTRQASNGENWNTVLTALGDKPLVRTLQRFLGSVVNAEELAARQKSRLPHAVILGGRDIKAIDQMVFSKDRPTKGGHFRANPIAETITVLEPSEAVRTVDKKLLANETHVQLADGLPTDLPFEDHSEQLIVGLRNTEGMDGRTLSDFYLELARVLQHGGVYVEGKATRSVNDSSFSRWKSLLAQMIVDTVEDRGTIPDRMDPDKEAAMLHGLGLTEQRFVLDGRSIRVLVKEGAVKELGWYALQGRGSSERLFGIEIGGKPDEPRFKRQRQTSPSTVVW
ncbi:MAG TPA: hypothetical protein VLF91_01120 [Candidatus Saccharimonadales bacterium]|nr:hypothetical protein [Candidatus Saccharimonadales bacterium]